MTGIKSLLSSGKSGIKSLLSSGKSAKPDSSNINPPSSNNAAPSSSRALPITPQADAHPAQGDISEAGSALTSDSPSLAHAGEDKVAEIGSPSIPSPPSPEKLRDHADRAWEAAEQYNKRIREATEGLNDESDVADLYAAFDKLSRLSDFIKKEKLYKKEKKIKKKEKEKEKKKKTEEKKKGKENENNLSERTLAIDSWDSWLSSKNLLTLKEVLYEAVSAAKDFTSSGDAKKMARGLIRDIAGGHPFNIVFIVVAKAWERFEDMRKNEKAYLSLLVEINKLAKIVIDQKKVLQNGPESKEMMEGLVKEAIELIIETCIACCNHIEASKTRRYFGTNECEDELTELKEQLVSMYNRMPVQMLSVTLAAVERLRPHHPECSKDPVGTKKPVQLRKPDYPEYPEDAVGIEDPLKEVIERLEMGSDKRAVAVILHGFGGIGKTTLANAVFARLFEGKTEGCKFSFVELFKDIETPPNIEELQKIILRDLKGDEPDEIRSQPGGQKQIESMLEQEEAFIYIDNVLLPDKPEGGPDALTRLLPEKMANAKKLRLLITTRDKNATRRTMCVGVEKKFYPIKSLPDPIAVEILRKKLNDNGHQLDTSQIAGIVKICGGVPQLLKVLAGFINGGEGSAVENYETLMREAEENKWTGKIAGSIKQYVFAYDKLEDNLKDPFLDICSFFRGWDWKVLSDIVGKEELQTLEQREFVTLDVKSMTARVHDVILKVGLQRTEGNRFRLTTASEIKDFRDIEHEDLQKIKGIWASDNKDPLRIPASKLDSMSRSLRVLKLGPLKDVEGKCEKKFKELVFFSAITSHLPFDVSKLKGFEKLRHLCYNPADLQNLSQMPPHLRHVDINLNSPAFQVSSNCIQRLRYLRVLRLSNAQFKCLPQELGDMGNGWEEVSISGCQYLEDLSISGCQYLEKVSISTLKSLRVLRMDRCSGLTQLGKGLGSLTSLQKLSLDGCESLESLPSELENLTSLQELHLSWCESLKELPSSLGKLRSLQELHLSGCKSLKELPSSLGQLRSLQELHLHSCESLQALPNNLEGLSLLRLLDLSSCHKIKDLPGGLEKLTSLVELTLGDCWELSSIPGTIGQLQLNSIDFSFSNLKELPDGFCNFSTLTELDMTDCKILEKLPERFGEVSSLRKLIMTGCCRVQKLPESFNRLKYLEHLDLSRCSTLDELCEDFKDLSGLRVLSLHHCGKLKNLPQGFECLTSLEVLDVRNCHKLEEKWIDSMLQMEKLQIRRIAGSNLLEDRWKKIQAQQSCSCAVHTEQGLSNEENLLKQLQSKFDSTLTNGEGKPLKVSGLHLHGPLLVMFDGQQEFHHDFPLPLLEESIDDIQTPLEMVYFGNHWDELPEKVKDRIVGHAPANRDAKALFQKLLSLARPDRTDFDWDLANSFQMTAEIVRGEKGDKYLSRWKLFKREDVKVEEFVVTKCGRYLKLKQLAERPGVGPIASLRELFAEGEEENSLSFLKDKDGESTEVRVDELKGKTILLDIRPANTCYAIPLQALVEMYVREKEILGFEIITVPICQGDTTWDVSKKFSKEVPWLVLQTPWQLTNATKYFLVEGFPRWIERLRRPEGWDSWYPNRMSVIESDGTIAPCRNRGVLRRVNTWRAAAYPFTAEGEEDLIQKEKTQMEAMSHAMFLFQHLERVAQQLEAAARQQKMICLCCCHPEEFTSSMKDVLTELSDIIYIIYIPYFRPGGGESGYFTATIDERFSLEPSKMSSAEMGRIFWLSLSEYEAMRFWARIRSLKEGIKATDQIQLWEMLRIPNDHLYGTNSWMFIMDEDGKLITTKGKEIVKLLSENYSDDIVKGWMQQLIKGTKDSRKQTLFNLQEFLSIDSEDSEGDLEESDSEDSEGDLEESDDVESQSNLSEELCSDDADRDSDDGDREGDDVFQEN